MYDSKSGLTFLQRSGLIQAYVNPEPRLQPCNLLAHNLPLEAPLPPPDVVQLVRESEAPDRYAARPWPHEAL
jgi:hypothetical protein